VGHFVLVASLLARGWGFVMNDRRRQGSVSTEIAATPDVVWGLVSDITRMGEWSPECRQCAWIGGATGPVVGARFKARNKADRGPSWSNKPEVVAAEPGREFAFARSGPGMGKIIWRYQMEPSTAGTTLTESYEEVEPAAKWMIWVTMKMTGIDDRTVDLEHGMQNTLERIKTAAEQIRGG
jgi:hypothetical protein